MTFTFGWALAILVVMYYVSSVLSTKTRARIGTMIFFSVFILIGYWTIFPADIIATSQIPVVAAITNLVLLINVGSSFDLATLKQDWRGVVVTLVGCLGMGVFGLDMAISSYPCLVGGLVATNLVNETLMNKGLEDLAVTIVLMLSMQTFVGMPVMSFGARKECERLLADYRTGKIIAADPKQDAIAKSTPHHLQGPYRPYPCQIQHAYPASGLLPVLGCSGQQYCKVYLFYYQRSDWHRYRGHRHRYPLQTVGSAGQGAPR